MLFNCILNSPLYANNSIGLGLLLCFGILLAFPLKAIATNININTHEPMPIVEIQQSITINKPVAQVFAFIANYSNDKYWRTIVHETTLSTDSMLEGTMITERYYLSKKYPDYKATYRCIHFENDVSVIVQTTASNEFFSKNIRSVKYINNATTEVSYTYLVDSAIVTFGLGYKLPFWLIRWAVRKEMQRYLKRLRIQLESA